MPIKNQHQHVGTPFQVLVMNAWTRFDTRHPRVSQKELTRRLNRKLAKAGETPISQQTISNYVRGQTLPREDPRDPEKVTTHLNYLADVLEVDRSEMFDAWVSSRTGLELTSPSNEEAEQRRRLSDLEDEIAEVAQSVQLLIQRLERLRSRRSDPPTA